MKKNNNYYRLLKAFIYYNSLNLNFINKWGRTTIITTRMRMGHRKHITILVQRLKIGINNSSSTILAPSDSSSHKPKTDRDQDQEVTNQVCTINIFKHAFFNIWIFKTYCEQLIYSDFLQSSFNYRHLAQAQGFSYLSALGTDQSYACNE